jgi:SAM-dependent methyltransferase/energy-coupling factor transporter ATP-binding protein EcfA2
VKLLEVTVPANPELGLKAISLKRLGQIVILAGKNGAGKSRILRELVSHISKKTLSPFPWTIANLPHELRGWNQPAGAAITTHDEVSTLLRDRLGTQSASIIALWDSVRLSRIEQFRFVWLNPKVADIIDVRTLSPIQLEQQSSAACASSIDDLRKQVLARIQDLQSQWFNAQYNQVDASASQREDAIAEYQRLQKIVDTLLGTQLGRDLRGNITLFGRVIGEAGLSEGQKILLLWSVMLHSQVQHLSQAIIICDEPENHLHPQALLDAIERITEALPEVQLWIATHSLPLLSHFDPSSIFWVEDGTVEFAGTKPLMVLRGLLGNDDRIGRLHDFLGLPANLAANRFAAQCLVEPYVSDRGEGDPQTGQIRRLLAKVRPGESLRILDFGAGRGRLAADLIAARSSNDRLAARINYVAFEPSLKHHDELVQRVGELHGDNDDRIFSDLGTLTSKIGLRTFDVVVLCNVLHELPVADWLKYFGENGRLLDLLREEGHLLLVEDTLLPVGESPHPGGFLVLESPPLFEFLQCSAEDVARDQAASNPRLVAHLVPRVLLGRPTKSSLTKALSQVVKMAAERIDALRSRTAEASDLDGNERYRAGREHAFYVHQFTNATRNL